MRRLARSVWAEVVARTAYRLILRRPIGSGALTGWRLKLTEQPSRLFAMVNALVVSEEYRRLARPESDTVVLN